MTEDGWITVEEAAEPAHLRRAAGLLRERGLEVQLRPPTDAGPGEVRVALADLDDALLHLEELDDGPG